MVIVLCYYSGGVTNDFIIRIKSILAKEPRTGLLDSIVTPIMAYGCLWMQLLGQLIQVLHWKSQ